MEKLNQIKEILDTRGVKFHFNTEVVSVETSGGKITGFRDQNGKLWIADIYISNSDAAAYRGDVTP